MSEVTVKFEGPAADSLSKAADRFHMTQSELVAVALKNYLFLREQADRKGVRILLKNGSSRLEELDLEG